MRKSSLNGLPPVRLPEGYSLRNFQHGDEVGWAGLVDGAIGSWDPQLARDRFLREQGVVASGIFFVMRDAEYVATATAKRRQEDAPYTGYLHMVAVAAASRGIGIGLSVSLAALHRLREDGCLDAILDTDDDRLAAIRTYLKLGFTPDYVAPDHPERWGRVQEKLAERRQGKADVHV
jgi:mycothiol synthase